MITEGENTFQNCQLAQTQVFTVVKSIYAGFFHYKYELIFNMARTQRYGENKIYPHSSITVFNSWVNLLLIIEKKRGRIFIMYT